MLDEPAAGLDGAERRTAVTVFRALADETGAAVLLVDSNVDVVAAACDELVVLNFGEVITSSPTSDVLAILRCARPTSAAPLRGDDTSTTVASDT